MTGIGIVGLGEFGTALARELVQEGHQVCCCDPRPGTSKVVDRATEIGIPVYRSPDGFASRVSEVFVTVTADRSLDVVQDLSVALIPGTVYVDCATKSPKTRDSVRRIAESASLSFVDAALLDSVRISGRPVHMVVSGPGAEEAAKSLAGSRFVPEVLGDRCVSAELKLCRSIFTKGQEVLLIETLAVGEALGVRDIVFKSLERVIDRDLRSTCEVTVGSTLRHARRRASEMGAASALAAELLGSAPLTEAVARVFDVVAREVQDDSNVPVGAWEAVVSLLVDDGVFNRMG